ncbi:DUF6415 family natural product biosynthesis protein [Streptomyces sp. NPDC002520]
MRLSLASRRDACNRLAPSSMGRIAIRPGSRQNQVVAAAETVALVLDEESPLPDDSAAVEELARRLRGHVSELGVVVSPGAPALRRAQQLGSAGVPNGYVPSMVYLVRLAEATQELVASVHTHGVSLARPQRGRRWRKRGINLLRGTVLAVAFFCLVPAASVPRT